MDYLGKFENYIIDNQLASKSDRIVLGVSGGKDSMVMTELFYRLGYPIILAHCNFNLRGEEANQDEALVREYAQARQLPFYVQSFQTKEYAAEHKISIQMAARELRYTWFEELRIQQKATCIAIAQHMNDQIETVLLNLTRGTGLKGLNGIKPIRNRIIRPLLEFSVDDIYSLAREWQVEYRDDVSNFETKYARNKVRLRVIPTLKEINPEFDQTFIQNIQNFQDAYTLLNQFVQPIKEGLFIPYSSTITQIETDKLKSYLSNKPLMYELLSDFQFSKPVIEDLIQTWDNGSGRIFESPTHRLLFDRNHIYIKRNGEKNTEEVYLYENQTLVSIDELNIEVHIDEPSNIVAQENIAQLDFSKVVFPVRIRKWKHGDKFVPLGMTTQKKVSDYLIGKKINLFQKEEIYVLENGDGNIMWIINQRLDNRFKMTENTRKVLTLVLAN